MRIFVLTQHDAFYIPRLLDHLFESRGDIVGVGIVPGEMRSKNFARYLRLMGIRDLSRQLSRLASYKVMAKLGGILGVDRSFSVPQAARRSNVPCFPVENVNAPAFIEKLRGLQVELLVSVACPQVCRKELLCVPRNGAINIHGALLPDYQGLLPSFWVLANGEEKTGVTVHYMDEKLDHGDIILQQPVPIRPDDSVHSLVVRSKIEVGKHLLVKAISAIESGNPPREPMNISQARYFSFPDDQAIAAFRARGRRFV